MISSRICILGTGAWATALGVSLSKNNNTVFMWGINLKEINDINSGYNKKYFGENKFCSSLSATNDLSVAIGNSKFIVLAVPSNAVVDVINKLKTKISKKSKLILVSVVKGLDDKTNNVISKTIKKLLKGYKIKLATICGPSFASEVFNNKPTIVNVASSDLKTSIAVSKLFNCDILKVIPCLDEIGLQVYSALKNLLAIGIGLASEQYNSIDTTSAMLTLGVNEMAMIGKKMGAKKKTIFDFCGIGDIFLTCTSKQSRNYSFGNSLFLKGVEKTIIENTKTVEGYKVYKTVENIINIKKLDTPLFSSIVKLLNNELNPNEFVKNIWNLTYQKDMNIIYKKLNWYKLNKNNKY